jgi:predicted ATP-dependent serine protease
VPELLAEPNPPWDAWAAALQACQERLREAAKHGFKRAIVPYANAPRDKNIGIEVVAVKNLQQALEALL